MTYYICVYKIVCLSSIYGKRPFYYPRIYLANLFMSSDSIYEKCIFFAIFVIILLAAVNIRFKVERHEWNCASTYHHANIPNIVIQIIIVC